MRTEKTEDAGVCEARGAVIGRLCKNAIRAYEKTSSRSLGVSPCAPMRRDFAFAKRFGLELSVAARVRFLPAWECLGCGDFLCVNDVVFESFTRSLAWVCVIHVSVEGLRLAAAPKGQADERRSPDMRCVLRW